MGLLNIAYGTFDAKNEDIIMGAKVAEGDDFIMRLPQVMKQL
jgi:ATP-binding cassette subfamily B protein